MAQLDFRDLDPNCQQNIQPATQIRNVPLVPSSACVVLGASGEKLPVGVKRMQQTGLLPAVTFKNPYAKNFGDFRKSVRQIRFVCIRGDSY